MVAEEFDLKLYRDLLVHGTNVLALQGLNASPDDADFLLAPELIGESLRLDPGQPVYFAKPTPGAENNSGSATLGPIISEVEHLPLVPSDAEDLLIRARVTPSFRPIAGVTLRYRVMYTNEVATPMHDDGAHGDGAPADGVYTGRIPAAAARPGQMIRYALIATDNEGQTSRSPADADPARSPQYHGTIVEDPSLASTRLPVLHWFIQNPNAANSDTRASCSVFFAGEFYDNIGGDDPRAIDPRLPQAQLRLRFQPRLQVPLVRRCAAAWTT